MYVCVCASSHIPRITSFSLHSFFLFRALSFPLPSSTSSGHSLTPLLLHLLPCSAHSLSRAHPCASPEPATRDGFTAGSSGHHHQRQRRFLPAQCRTTSTPRRAQRCRFVSARRRTSTRDLPPLSSKLVDRSRRRRRLFRRWATYVGHFVAVRNSSFLAGRLPCRHFPSVSGRYKKRPWRNQPVSC